ncbi:hypothetical protein RchiOBHm_Chr2g0102381 [Rosa chinensis]|uniref:Uncharacterized protein n=2 Tax=Rosa chinensis TaxID=74649 RepID=A0A2P6RMM0_ROSCH|nr:hypothetical protein RchiOBHm_Chr2g0102381 [Rosa chinensis]
MRGKTRGLNADKVHEQLSTKIPVTFKKENGRPTGPYAEMFANEIGFTIRNHAPLNVKKWKEVKPEDRTSLIKRIITKYNIDMSLPWEQLNTLKWSTKALKRVGTWERKNYGIKWLRCELRQPFLMGLEP